MEPPRLKGYEFSDETVNEYLSKGQILTLLLAYNFECNLSCPFCFTDAGTRAPRNLSKERGGINPLRFEELTSVIDQGVELGIRSVCFFGEGEPLLKKYLDLFFKVVDYVNDNNIVPVVFTNGVLIDSELARNLHDKNVSVVGKLYSLDPEKNEFLTGNHRIYKYTEFKDRQVPSHIPDLVKAGYDKGDRFAVFAAVTRYNYSEIRDIWEWERRAGIIPYADFLYTYRSESDFGISEEERERLCESIYDCDRSLGIDYKYHVGPHIGHRRCNTRIAAVIGASGQMRICPAVDIYIGDIRKQSLRELLEKKASVEKKICFECEEKGVCGAYKLEERVLSNKVRINALQP